MKKKIQLFCLPYAGGTIDCFKGIGDALAETMDIISIEYSGHGKRIKEKFYSTFQEMVDDAAAKINEQIDPEADVAVFGYSMGSIVAYEMIAQQKLSKEPCCMIFASHEAPDIEWESKQYYKADDEMFFQLIQSMGGFERCTLEMLGNRFFKRMHYDPLRADYELLGMYKMSRKITFEVPTLLFYSEKDISKEKIQSWESFLGENGRILEVGENHFFIQTHAEYLAEEIENILLK